MTKIILLGSCCRISKEIRNLNLKDDLPNSLFEYTCNIHFDEVLKVINNIIKFDLLKEPITMRINEPNDFFLYDTSIKTNHYNGTLEQKKRRDKSLYEYIFRRRSLRFINDIKSGEPILFIRDTNKEITKKQYDEFNNIIKSINKKCYYKLLIIDLENQKESSLNKCKTWFYFLNIINYVKIF